MKKFYLSLACLFVSMSSSFSAYAQEESEIKFTTTKEYGESLSMWPKSTAKADTIRVDWGDGNIKTYNIDPKGAPFFTKVNGKIMGDTIRIYTQLVKLDLAGAGVTSFSTKNQPLLQDLLLNQNQLTTYEIDLTGAKNLKLIDLSQNQLSTFDARPFEQLEMFSANENPQLSTALFYEGSEHLRSISMMKCDISHFYPTSLPALEGLNLSYGSLLELEIGEYYPRLSTLDISNNYIAEIDITKCPLLETLNVTGNQLKKLEITANPEIINLFCANNQIKELNLANNVNITTLTCGHNLLTELKVNQLTKLARLNCEENAISRLDLSQNFYLNKLECKQNQLEFLDFAGSPRMDYIDCRFNSKMTSHTVNYMFSTLLGRYSDSYMPNLLIEGCNAEHANTAEMNTTEMKWKTDIQGDGTAEFSNVNLTVAPAANGSFTLSQPTEYGKNYKEITTSAVIGTPIKVSAQPAADYAFSHVVVNGKVINDTLFVIEEEANIEVSFKSIKAAKMVMGVQKDTPLSFALMAPENNTEIQIDWGNGVPATYQIGKKITRIDGTAAGDSLVIKGNIAEADFSSYPGMGMWENNFTSLTVSNSEALEALNTYMNPIQKLEVTHCPNLQFLDCSFSELSELDVTANEKLVSLICYGNQIQALDLTHNPNLVVLNAKSNQLTTIDLSANPLLESVDLQNNAIEKVEVAHLTELAELALANNLLTTVNVQNNKALHILNVSGNALTNLDLSHNPNLGKLLCGDNNIAQLDLSHQMLLYYVNCENNKMSACALNDLYYSLNEYPALEEPLKGHTLWVRGTDPEKMNDADHAESIIATGKGWMINAEGDATGCDEAYVTILEPEHGSVTLFTADQTPVLSGNKVKKNSTLKVVATPEEGYRLTKITANGKVAENGEFIITRATDVTARFEVATGIESVEADELVIKGAKGGITVVSETPAVVTVYHLGGQQVAQQTVASNGTVALAAGTYVVNVQNENLRVSKVVIVF